MMAQLVIWKYVYIILILQWSLEPIILRMIQVRLHDKLRWILSANKNSADNMNWKKQ
jgi:hypothetical protein